MWILAKKKAYVTNIWNEDNWMSGKKTDLEWPQVHDSALSIQYSCALDVHRLCYQNQ